MADNPVAAEEERLSALQHYDVLDTEQEESFDRITRLAQGLMQTPIALVSLIDRERQWFKSRVGIDAHETPRDISFCTHAIRGSEPMIVPDALEDDRFRNNPMVTGDPGIRFYLGVPLRTPGGHHIGTLCTIDRQPREVAPFQVALLQDLARLVIDELELRQIATSDSLTGALTRRGFTRDAEQAIHRARRYGRPLGCIALDVDHFKSVNDTHGHAAGDMVLRAIVATLRSIIRSVDIFGRVGGEEFAIIVPDTDLADTMQMAERVRQAIADSEIVIGPTSLKVTASLGVSTLGDNHMGLGALLDDADSALYRAKANGRNRVETAVSARDVTSITDQSE